MELAGKVPDMFAKLLSNLYLVDEFIQIRVSEIMQREQNPLIWATC
jgi:hypothetical protein